MEIDEENEGLGIKESREMDKMIRVNVNAGDNEVIDYINLHHPY